MARHRRADLFPPPLAAFSAKDWGRVAGECLGHYGCRAGGYEADCVPPPGASCGDGFYALLADPWRAQEARHRDARVRWRQARMAWLTEDHPAWLDEFVAWLGET